MPIVDVRTRPFSAELHTPFVTSLRRTTTVDTLLVTVADSDGHVGVGEAPQVWQVTGASIAGSQACIDQLLGPALIGRDPDDLVANCTLVARAAAANEAAKSALDCALHDLAARRLGIPLARMLGGATLSVATDVTLSAGDAGGLAAAATARVTDGFDILKVKVGTDAATDVARVKAVRAAVGPDIRIRLDANQGWNPRDAVRVIHGLQDGDLGVELVEQPVPHWDLDGLAWVSDRVDVPILADEAVYSARDLVEVIRRRAADMVNIKLAKSGGLSAARTMLGLAEAYDMGRIVGSMMETTVGLGAAASLVAAYGTTAASDLDAAWWLAKAPFPGGPHYEGNRVILADAPGLGIVIDDREGYQ